MIVKVLIRILKMALIWAIFKKGLARQRETRLTDLCALRDAETARGLELRLYSSLLWLGEDYRPGFYARDEEDLLCWLQSAFVARLESRITLVARVIAVHGIVNSMPQLPKELSVIRKELADLCVEEGLLEKIE